MKLHNLILEITIPNYLREVQLSKARRAVYYEWKDKLGIRAWKTAMSKGKQIPKSYINNHTKNLYTYSKDGQYMPHDLNEKYGIAIVLGNKIKNYFGAKISTSHQEPSYLLNYCVNIGILTAKQKQRAKCILYNINKKELVLSNPKAAGTPNMYIINGQDFYSGNINPIVRSKVVTVIKKSFVPHLDNHIIKCATNSISERPNDYYPFVAVLEIHDTIKNKYDKTSDPIGTGWDVGNRGYLPYLKTMVDLLVTGKVSKDEDDEPFNIQPVLREDDRLHIRGEAVVFHPIPEGGTPKLVFKFYNLNFNQNENNNL